MTGFLRQLFGGRVSLEQREGVLAYMAEEWKLRSLQVAEMERHDDVITEYGGPVTPVFTLWAEISESVRSLSQVFADLRQRHTNVGPVPDEASACYFNWERTYLTLEEWASATVAMLEAVEAGREEAVVAAKPHIGRVEQLGLAGGRAEREALREEAKLLKRLGIGPPGHSSIAGLVERRFW